MVQEGSHLCLMSLLFSCLWHNLSKKHRKPLWFESLSILTGNSRQGFQSSHAEDGNMSFPLLEYVLHVLVCCTNLHLKKNSHSWLFQRIRLSHFQITAFGPWLNWYVSLLNMLCRRWNFREILANCKQVPPKQVEFVDFFYSVCWKEILFSMTFWVCLSVM